MMAITAVEDFVHSIRRPLYVYTRAQGRSPGAPLRRAMALAQIRQLVDESSGVIEAEQRLWALVISYEEHRRRFERQARQTRNSPGPLRTTARLYQGKRDAVLQSLAYLRAGAASVARLAHARQDVDAEFDRRCREVFGSGVDQAV